MTILGGFHTDRDPAVRALVDEHRRLDQVTTSVRRLQTRIEDEYDAALRARIVPFSVARDSLHIILEHVVLWMRGETGEPTTDRALNDGLGTSFPRKRDWYGWWAVRANPKRGWAGIEYTCEYSPLSSLIMPPERDIQAARKMLIAHLGQPVSIWKGGGGPAIGIFGTWSTGNDVVVELDDFLKKLHDA